MYPGRVTGSIYAVAKKQTQSMYYHPIIDIWPKYRLSVCRIELPRTHSRKLDLIQIQAVCLLNRYTKNQTQAVTVTATVTVHNYLFKKSHVNS